MTSNGGVSSVGGTTSNGGATSAGGSTAAGGSTPTGGSAVTATGGSTGMGGTTAAGGSTETGTFQPLCASLTTAAGAAPTKGGTCTAADPQLCYKTCGPESKGFKSETCTASATGSAYVEQSGCTFPTGADYSCYKIPAVLSASCPTTTPQASTACSVAACTVCNVAGNYLDSGSVSKVGNCVCPASVAGTSKWSCASSTAWPCPGGQGC
jgi:hypothetical protein